MKLLRLSLRNFKGIREFTLEPNGEDVTVYGDNATGKTTLVDAFMWLLFDKDSQNRKDFQIKTLGPDGEPIHNLEHEVEATLELDDGRRVTLRKVYREVWTKRRGSARPEFSGHTTDHYIDGVPVRKAEYEATVASIAPEERFRLLTDPGHFARLHWQERRRLLLEVCGDVTDAEVIASEPALAELPAILGTRSLDDHRRVVQARRTEINRELERIPVRIDEVRRGLPEIPAGVDEAALRADLERLRARRAELEAERVRIQTGGQAAELARQLAEVRAELATAEQRAREAAGQQVREARQRLAEVEDQIAARRRELQRVEREQAEERAEVERLHARMDALRADWYRVDAETPVLDQQEACPACGQPLPEERLRAAREVALAEFNERKARRLEEITAEGRRLRQRADELAQACERREAAMAALRQEIAALEARAAELRAAVERAQAEAPDPAQDPEVQRLRAERDRLTAEMAALQAGNAEALRAVAGEIAAVDQQIAALEGQVGQLRARARGLARIAELEAEERRLAAEFEALERQLHLCDLFLRAKVRLLTDRINSRFRLARFQLFRTLVNGGLEECCEVTYQGVPYADLNHGAQLNAGLDIINTLAEHYGIAPPVWIDNAESVTSILPTRGQQIRLVVSAGDRALRVEIPVLEERV